MHSRRVLKSIKKKKNFTCRFKLNSNIIQISIEILIQTTQTFKLSTTLFRENSIIFILLYIQHERGKSYRKYGGEERSCIEILRFWMKGESESMTREKKCNIDWILESERMQNRRAHINSFDLLNRLIWMFKFQARSTQFARTPRLFNSFPSTIQTVLASTTTKPGQLAC